MSMFDYECAEDVDKRYKDSVREQLGQEFGTADPVYIVALYDENDQFLFHLPRAMLGPSRAALTWSTPEAAERYAKEKFWPSLMEARKKNWAGCYDCVASWKVCEMQVCTRIKEVV